MTINHFLDDLEAKALQNISPSKEEALKIFEVPEADMMEVVASVRRVREKFFGTQVKLNYLVNIKSGLCSEDCHYCSQSKISEAPIEKYPLLKAEEFLSQVKRGLELGASRICLVGSGREPSDLEFKEFVGAIKTIREAHGEIELCASLGFLSQTQADYLKEVGLLAYNHNLNTSESHYVKICGTHTYAERAETIEHVKKAGLSSCSGVLVGMGETTEDLTELAFTLKGMDVCSIPINFLVPVPETPLGHCHDLTPWKCLQVLALFRFVNPATEIRMAGGREFHLRSLQPLGLMMANSIFIGDYLTTRGQTPQADLEMIRDIGYRVQNRPPEFLTNLLGRSTPDLITATHGHP